MGDNLTRFKDGNRENFKTQPTIAGSFYWRTSFRRNRSVAPILLTEIGKADTFVANIHL